MTLFAINGIHINAEARRMQQGYNPEDSPLGDDSRTKRLDGKHLDLDERRWFSPEGDEN